MNKTTLIELNIDDEFKNLIPPLSSEEKALLEESILEEGCREAILIWKDCIIDGHNRYEICHKHGILFATKNIHFDSREEAVAWICKNQLGRRNISEETRKYLIGKRYESEKFTTKNHTGSNQYVEGKEVKQEISTARKLGEEYHMSHQTVSKYGAYTRAIDKIGEKQPTLVHKILSGDLKISHGNVIAISNMQNKEISEISKNISDANKGYVRYKDSRKGISSGFKVEENVPVAIKQMPQYDPDAELTSLKYTIPSWISSIERVERFTRKEECSKDAKENCIDQLLYLIVSCEKMMKFLEE